MPEAVNRRVIMTGFAVWTKSGSRKVWIEAGRRWAHAIVDYDASALATIVSALAPTPFGAMLGTMIMVIAKWHASKLRRYLGPNGIWIGIDPALFAGKPQNSIGWWNKVDARPRTPSNMQKEPVPW